MYPGDERKKAGPEEELPRKGRRREQDSTSTGSAGPVLLRWMVWGMSPGYLVPLSDSTSKALPT